jgi:hypothetical protein
VPSRCASRNDPLGIGHPRLMFFNRDLRLKLFNAANGKLRYFEIDASSISTFRRTDRAGRREFVPRNSCMML